MIESPKPLTGNHVLVSWLNKLLRFAQSLRIKSGVGYKVDYSTDGIVLRIDGGGGGGGGMTQRFRVKSCGDDHLVCRTWDGTTEGGTDVKVAKAYKLRHSITSATVETDAGSTTTINYTYASRTNNLDGKRYADYGGGSVTEIVVPRWLVNDQIWATKVIGTGVTVSSVELTWLDDNRDGRAWAAKATQP